MGLNLPKIPYFGSSRGNGEKSWKDIFVKREIKIGRKGEERERQNEYE